MLVAFIFYIIFFLSFFPPSPHLFFFSYVDYFSNIRSSRIKKLIKQNLTGASKNLSRSCRPFWGPLAAILEFAGSAALQEVSECPWLDTDTVLHQVILPGYCLIVKSKPAM